ncbi:uncharacterized protein LOC126070179 isoform X3 [Elephas maximus indicus]|uniref:uncharacterized protein LOC126070179 isoform X3 n=1 Tax=Elephas maximus indicus TaxID=99487 RepID=UPI0021161DB3|nr:uncharacterized protein LOC126070179 isoform X3 [Elephas maximus indicus]
MWEPHLKLTDRECPTETLEVLHRLHHRVSPNLYKTFSQTREYFWSRFLEGDDWFHKYSVEYQAQVLLEKCLSENWGPKNGIRGILTEIKLITAEMEFQVDWATDCIRAESRRARPSITIEKLHWGPGMGGGSSISVESPLRCILTSWKCYSYAPITKKMMIFYAIVFGHNINWQVGSLAWVWVIKFNTIFRLDLFCRREKKWDEVPYVQGFMSLYQNMHPSNQVLFQGKEKPKVLPDSSSEEPLLEGWALVLVVAPPPPYGGSDAAAGGQCRMRRMHTSPPGPEPDSSTSPPRGAEGETWKRWVVETWLQVWFPLLVLGRVRFSVREPLNTRQGNIPFQRHQQGWMSRPSPEADTDGSTSYMKDVEQQDMQW